MSSASRGRFRPITSKPGDHCRIAGLIGSRGPIVEVEIGPTLSELERSRREGRIVASQYRARGIIDTAAEKTCILESTAATLLFAPVGRTSVANTSGVVRSVVYSLSLQFGLALDRLPKPIEVSAPCVQGILDGAELLIGLDVVRQGILVVNGPESRYELILP